MHLSKKKEKRLLRILDKLRYDPANMTPLIAFERIQQIFVEQCGYYCYERDSNGEIAISYCCHPENQSDYEGNCRQSICPLLRN